MKKITFILLIYSSSAFAQSIDSLREGFKNPPMDAWPRTWWHWTRSNVSKEGITKDLEWMKRSGIAGFQLADVNAGGGQAVADPIVFGTPRWQEALRHAAAEADRLGLEMAVFSSPGWSLTGGPWVKPEQAMKKLVWSELNIPGPQKAAVKLQSPPSGEGAGPNFPNGGSSGFYRDVAVIAFRTPTEVNTGTPAISGSNFQDTASKVYDNDLNTGVTVRPDPGNGNAWMQLTYDRPFTARAITIAARRGIPFGRVLASNDGKNYITLAAIPGKSGYRGGNIRTYTFPETTAKYFKLEFTNAPPRPADIISQATTPADTAYTISEIQIHPGTRINRWQDKAGFNFLFEYSDVATPATSGNAAIDPSSVIDLTAKMSADGSLNWIVPKGHWTIMRFGYALTGAKNRPAVPAALGYEVDKLNPQHVISYMTEYTGLLKNSLGSLYGKRLQYFLLDSWEAGIQNWTDIMPAEFKKRRGYDLISYLPALTGRVVGNSEISDRFLWDFRRTLIDMIAENHYGVITDFLHKQGLKTYGEAGGVSLESMEDALLNKKFVDIPMGEFWVRDLHPSSMYYEDVRGAASASHVYGQNLVAAEAFTGGNFESPQTLKTIADYWFTQGVNRLVFHTSAHQPADDKPGNTMVGTHLHRNITWAENVRPLTTYFARNSYMLQKGKYVADIAYLLNEGAPSTMPFWGAGLQPPVPKGYQFDYINADILLHYLSVNAAGKLALPDGITYSLLVLPPTREMSLPLLKKIKELIAAGAIIVGPKPESSPGLAGFAESENELKALALEIWADLDGNSRTQRRYGKGKIVWGQNLEQVLSGAGIAKDAAFDYATDKISWIHRRDGGLDIYFVVNRRPSPMDISGVFNVAGKDVELWRPVKGTIEPAAYNMDSNSTTVRIPLKEEEAVFVVFGNKSALASRAISPKPYSTLTELTGEWKLAFPKGYGAPENISIQQLNSWTENANEGVKYFSGTAIYRKNFEVKKEWLKPGQSILLNLGVVKDIAEIKINGKKTETLWTFPFEADITKVVKYGINQLEISVTNQWTNRLRGDQDNPGKKILSSLPPPFGGRQYELTPAGLLGPVKLMALKTQNLADTIAKIPVNYDEESVGTYSLPDPLLLKNGRKVTDTQTWIRQRRPEVLSLFEKNQFGKAPGRPADMTFDVFDKGTLVFNGAAIRKQVTIYFTKDTSKQKMDVLIYIPAKQVKPAPLLLNISFVPNSLAVDDAGIKPDYMWSRDGKRIPAARSAFRKFDIEKFTSNGIAVATLYYGDIEPDFPSGIQYGIRSHYLSPGNKPAPGEWGAIAAWAWGLSRAMDYFETDKDIDAEKVVLTGASRLGKTVLWAAANDQRFAMVIASISGEGGAALSRRNYGETVAHITDTSRYFYQFAPNYHSFANKVNQLPVDAHMLIALIAPRPLLLQTGDSDYWSDPKGEFLAAQAAEPVYRLFNKSGVGNEYPTAADTSLLNTLGYYMHEGGHAVLPGDYDVFIQFILKHLE
jgi:hypothetical protein